MGSPIGSLRVDKRLTDFSVKYKNGVLVAEQVAPFVTVKNKSDKYVVYKRSDFRVEDDLRAPGTESREVYYEIDTDGTYSCNKRSLKMIVSDDDRDNADQPLDLDFDRTEDITNRLLLGHEKRVGDLMTATANVAAGHYETLSGTQQFNNASFNSTSKEDAIEVRIDAGKEAVRKDIGLEPNTIVIPSAVAKVIKKDSAIRDLIKYTDQTLLVNGDLPRTLWNMKVLIPGAVYDSANRGQTYSGSDVWGKHIVIAYVAPKVGLRSFTAAATFISKQRQIKKWRVEAKESDYVEGTWILVPKIVCSDCFYIIRNAIA